MKIGTEMDKNLQKMVRKYGSVLKAYRTKGGWGAGICALGIMLIVTGILLGGLMALVNPKVGMVLCAILAVPGILIAPIGQAKYRKRVDEYLDFYQKDTGYSVEELQEADRELMSPNAVKITCTLVTGARETVFCITDHYFLSARPVEGAYLLKLNDIVAAFCSDEIPGGGKYHQNLFIISRQDTRKEGIINNFTKKQYRGFQYPILANEPVYLEVYAKALDELTKKAPHIITYQKISVKGIQYDLLSMDNWREDWARIFEE